MAYPGLILDRDGVINRERGYVHKVSDFEFMPGLFPALRHLQGHGLRLAIATNQSGVARGYYDEHAFHALTEWMLQQFAQEGISIDLVMACFEHVEGTVTSYARNSFWRKPNPGMLLEAMQTLHLLPSQTAFVGDKVDDMQAAARAGCRWRILMAKTNIIPPCPLTDSVTNWAELETLLTGKFF